jgi:hypothetical protein
MRRILAARFAEGWVRVRRSFPPEIWFSGLTVSHEAKCFSEGHRLIVETDLGDELERAVGPDARKLGEVDAPAQREQRRADVEAGLIGAAGLRSGRGQPTFGRIPVRLQRPDPRLDLGIQARSLSW